MQGKVRHYNTRQDKTRQDKTRQEKRGQDKRRQVDISRVNLLETQGHRTNKRLKLGCHLTARKRSVTAQVLSYCARVSCVSFGSTSGTSPSPGYVVPSMLSSTLLPTRFHPKPQKRQGHVIPNKNKNKKSGIVTKRKTGDIFTNRAFVRNPDSYSY